jgi:hypothetical protein
MRKSLSAAVAPNHWCINPDCHCKGAQHRGARAIHTCINRTLQ